MKRFTGGCHCGAIRLTFETSLDPADVPLRACQCSFCRKHGARTAADRGGRATIEGGVEDIRRYRFGLRTSDFILCAVCGVYVAAVIEEAGDTFATVNVNLFEEPGFAGRAAEAVSYDGESEGNRRARRAARWTPAECKLV